SSPPASERAVTSAGSLNQQRTTSSNAHGASFELGRHPRALTAKLSVTGSPRVLPHPITGPPRVLGSVIGSPRRGYLIEIFRSFRSSAARSHQVVRHRVTV